MEEESMTANGGSSGGLNEGNICRDFLRNVCWRGKRCKFNHPDEKDKETLCVNKVQYVFCHDYQNKQCTRPNCKFIHCSREEEDLYKTSTSRGTTKTSELPFVQGIPVIESPLPRGEIPTCKDYLKGDCRRMSCKFRHASASEYDLDLYPMRAPRRGRFDFERFDLYDGTFEGPPEAKRRLLVTEETGALPTFREATPLLTTVTLSSPQQVEFRLLEDENLMLRKKIEELKKQVSDLTATNEFLLDQNAQLRLRKQTANVTTVSLPTVSIASSIPSTVQVQQIAPLSQALTQTLTQSLSQPLSLANELRVSAGQPTLAPSHQVVGNVRTVATVASIGTIPVTISAGPPTLAPVSVSMAPVSITQLAPPTVSIAQTMPPQQQPQPQSQQPQQAAQPQNLPMSISGASAPLMSFPIMTQGMRPVLQTSLSH